MTAKVLAGVWAYTLVAVFAEVYAAESISSTLLATSAVVAFALSQAAAVVLFYMDLKEEPSSIVFLVLIPLMFLSGLLISVVASLG